MPRRGLLSPILGAVMLTLTLAVGGSALRSQSVPSAQAAQSGQAGQVVTSPAALQGHTWKLVGITYDGHKWVVDPNATVTITFEDGQHVDGSGGCNSYGGAYTVSDGHVRVSEIIHTMMACLDTGTMAQENHYLGTLRQVTTFSASGSTLTLSDGTGQNVLQFVAA